MTQKTDITYPLTFFSILTQEREHHVQGFFSVWQNNGNCTMVKEVLAYCPNLHESSIYVLLQYKDDEKFSVYLLSIKVTHRFVCVLSLAMEGSNQNSRGLWSSWPTVSFIPLSTLLFRGCGGLILEPKTSQNSVFPNHEWEDFTLLDTTVPLMPTCINLSVNLLISGDLFSTDAAIIYIERI